MEIIEKRIGSDTDRDSRRFAIELDEVKLLGRHVRCLSFKILPVNRESDDF